MKVLIVDDNEALTGLLKEILEMEKDYHVNTAEDGEEAGERVGGVSLRHDAARRHPSR